jgi:hypothetical protein
MKRPTTQPILITDAQVSQDDDLRRRERRYIAMMLLRAGCLVLAAVLAGTGAPMLWLWLPLCGVGMVLLPWLAVILVNDRPPKDEHRMKRYRKNTSPANALPSQSAGRTIDGEL